MDHSPGPPSLWRNRSYLLLWCGQTVSSIGSGVSSLAFPLLILALTGSPAQAGLIGAAQALAYVLWILPAGALLDRWDRKRVMVRADIGRALVLASIPAAVLLGRFPPALFYLLALIAGTLDVFFDIASVSALPQVVSKEQLPQAMAQTQATLGVTHLLGPSLGSVLFAVSALLPFALDAASYAISVASLLLIRIPFQQERAARPRRLRAEIVEGLRWLGRQPLILSLALTTGGNILITAGYPLTIILLAQQHQLGAAAPGLILGLGGVGSIAGALVAPALQRRATFAQVILGTLWAYPVFWLLLIAAPAIATLGLLTLLLFFISTLYNVVYVSYRLAATPDHLQSRVNSVARLIAFSFRPPGLALAGLLLQDLGPRPTTLIFAAGLALLALCATLNPHLRGA